MTNQRRNCSVCGKEMNISMACEHEITPIQVPRDSNFVFSNNTYSCIMTIKQDGTVFFKDKEVVGDDDFKAMMKELHDVLCGKHTN